MSVHRRSPRRRVGPECKMESGCAALHHNVSATGKCINHAGQHPYMLRHQRPGEKSVPGKSMCLPQEMRSKLLGRTRGLNLDVRLTGL